MVSSHFYNKRLKSKCVNRAACAGRACRRCRAHRHLHRNCVANVLMHCSDHHISLRNRQGWSQGIILRGEFFSGKNNLVRGACCLITIFFFLSLLSDCFVFGFYLRSLDFYSIWNENCSISVIKRHSVITDTLVSPS